MADATTRADTKTSDRQTIGSATIREDEAAHFGKLAKDWWDPKGSSAMLHRLNPVRLGFIRAAIDAHWNADSRGVRPLAGKRALDVGCGAGLLCEPLARLGAAVTGVDAAQENVAVASAHAAGAGLSIDYRCGDVAHHYRRNGSAEPLPLLRIGALENKVVWKRANAAKFRDAEFSFFRRVTKPRRWRGCDRGGVLNVCCACEG